MNLKKLPKRSHKIPSLENQSEDFRIDAESEKIAISKNGIFGNHTLNITLKRHI